MASTGRDSFVRCDALTRLPQAILQLQLTNNHDRFHGHLSHWLSWNSQHLLGFYPCPTSALTTAFWAHCKTAIGSSRQDYYSSADVVPHNYET